MKINKKRTEQLLKEIEKHNHLYYNENAPIITDYEYDSLVLELKQLQQNDGSNDSLLNVGSPLSQHAQKIRHSNAMLSLNNAFNMEDINNFLHRIQKYLHLLNHDEYRFVCEPKIDGLSFSAVYKNGKLHHAATRGDGISGENITENVKAVINMPSNIPYNDDLEVRGEIYITKTDFLSLNNNRATLKQSLFANPRNAAAGSIRQSDPSTVAERKLRYIIWESSINHNHSHFDSLISTSKLGFNIDNNICIASSISDIEAYYAKMEELRASLPYDIDGLVYKLDNQNLQQEIGSSSRAPRWAIAHKFPGSEASSKILDITAQVSRNGVITPIAELQPINIGGVLITRATLHNYDEIARNDFRINDTVIVKRAGDVIPKILSVDKSKRGALSIAYTPPSQCHICNSTLVKDSETIAIRCPNYRCKAQIVERIRHFVSQEAFNIAGFSIMQIKQLQELGIMSGYEDIWKLHEHKTLLQNQHRWGAKSINNLLQSIEKAKSIPLSNFIYALGIRYVGIVSASLIAHHYISWNKMQQDVLAGKIAENLSQLKGIGEKTAQAIANFFSSNYNMDIINNLLHYIIIKDNEKTQKNIQSELLSDNLSAINNATIVLTGTLHNYTRQDIKSILTNLGAKISNSISRSTTYLIAGENPGSKIQKAKELDINILNEDDLIQMLKPLQ